jgi:hypothetical protein
MTVSHLDVSKLQLPYSSMGKIFILFRDALIRYILISDT